ncbi:glutamate receptor 1 [Plakobranchus ocellatus]|uniref:Glutamate receptor 1 n=1 Tax=Plakobranchus ocellatus TaxID=259542 RepID=A0AAV3Z248_9GAST|nr:glutamate receptor 1 [Plakobranchus ocellatus]
MLFVKIVIILTCLSHLPAALQLSSAAEHSQRSEPVNTSTIGNKNTGVRGYSPAPKNLSKFTNNCDHKAMNGNLGTEDRVHVKTIGCSGLQDKSRQSGVRTNCTVFQDMIKALKGCGWQRATVIIDSGDDRTTESNETLSDCSTSRDAPDNEAQCLLYRAEQLVLHTFGSAFIPVSHFRIWLPEEGIGNRSRLEEILWTSYLADKVRNFVWVSFHPWIILNAAETIFMKEQRGYGALMPHSTQFLLVGVDKSDIQPHHALNEAVHLNLPDIQPLQQLFLSTYTERTSSMMHYRSLLVEDTLAHLVTSSFDHVTLFIYSGISKAESYEKRTCGRLSPPYPLVWSHDRKRSFTKSITRPLSDNLFRNLKVKFNSNKKCPLFPNTYFGMNERPLTVLAKEWPPYLSAINASGNSLEYRGFLVEVISALARSMNFTYTLTPDPITSRNMTLRELERKLSAGREADFMARLYYVTSSLVYNQTLTHPIVMANMSGAYFWNPTAQHRGIFGLLERQLYLIIMIFFVTFVIFFSCINRFQNHLFGSGQSNIQNRSHLDGKRISTGSNIKTVKVSPWTPKRMKLVRFLSSAVNTIFDFQGSVFGQCNVPRPRYFTGQLLLFFWYFTLVLLTGDLKGRLASVMVRSKVQPPFSTLDEMQARGDYCWGHYNSSFLPIMKTAREQPLRSLYEGMSKFLASDPSVLAQTQEELVAKAATEDEKFVAIIDSFFLDVIIKSRGYHHIRVIPEILGTNGLGLNLPPQSELSDLMSEHVVKVVDSGLVDLFLKKMHHQLELAVNRTSSNSRQDGATSITDLKAELHIIFRYAPAAITAVFVLLIEILVARFCFNQGE